MGWTFGDRPNHTPTGAGQRTQGTRDVVPSRGLGSSAPASMTPMRANSYSTTGHSAVEPVPPLIEGDLLRVGDPDHDAAVLLSSRGGVVISHGFGLASAARRQAILVDALGSQIANDGLCPEPGQL